jgi:hypothetical protein
LTAVLTGTLHLAPSQLYKPDVLEDLMKESEHVVQRRKECVKMYVLAMPALHPFSWNPLLTLRIVPSHRVEALQKAENIVAGVGL